MVCQKIEVISAPLSPVQFLNKSSELCEIWHKHYSTACHPNDAPPNFLRSVPTWLRCSSLKPMQHKYLIIYNLERTHGNKPDKTCKSTEGNHFVRCKETPWNLLKNFCLTG